MLKAILITLVVPPVSFVFLAMLGLLILRRRRRIGYTFLGFAVGGLLLLSLPFFPDLLLAALERDLPMTPPADAMPQAIVILGGDVTRTVVPPYALPGYLTLDRLRVGAAIGRATKLPILVTGGTVQRDHPPVGALMATSLHDDFLIPATWVETASEDTWENAEFSAAILKKQGINSVYLVTQGWHMRRAILAFHRAGMTVTAVPTSLETPVDPIVADFFLPRATAWGWSYYAIHEWIGCAWYAIP